MCSMIKKPFQCFPNDEKLSGTRVSCVLELCFHCNNNRTRDLGVGKYFRNIQCTCAARLRCLPDYLCGSYTSLKFCSSVDKALSLEVRRPEGPIPLLFRNSQSCDTAWIPIFLILALCLSFFPFFSLSFSFFLSLSLPLSSHCRSPLSFASLPLPSLSPSLSPLSLSFSLSLSLPRTLVCPLLTWRGDVDFIDLPFQRTGPIKDLVREQAVITYFGHVIYDNLLSSLSPKSSEKSSARITVFTSK